MKKLFAIIFISLILSVLLFITFRIVMETRTQKGALQVTASPESKVYLNDKFIGKTPLCRCDDGTMLQNGDYTIRLTPTDNGLMEFQEKITITQGVLTVVDRKFAKDSLSEGYVISLTKLADTKKNELIVVSFPEKASVSLDDTDLGNTPLSHNDPTESDHLLKVSKDGYKEKTIRIRTPLGYKLTVAVYLSTLSDLSNATTEQSEDTTEKQTIIILDTPTGFLRVRDAIGGSEIGQVTPGETYSIVEENAGWFAIILSDGKTGWISSQYAKKNK
jgi:hypothetical protein